jgi:hypothetical protein
VDLDFYHLGPDKNGEQRILYNWCMMDLYALMVQTGRRMGIPKPQKLEEGKWYPPRTMTGIPAPTSEFVDVWTTRATNNNIVVRVLQLFLSGCDDSSVLKFGATSYSPSYFRKLQAGPTEKLFTDDVILYGNPFGIGMAHGQEDIISEVIQPVFVQPFGDRQINFDKIFCEGLICGAHGHIKGTMAPGKTFLGYEVSTPKVLDVRFGAHFVMDSAHADLFKDVYILIDVLSAFDSIGRDMIQESQQIH